MKHHNTNRENMPVLTVEEYMKTIDVEENKYIKKNCYYQPLYGTSDCTYEGKKRGRKTNIEKYNEQKTIKFVQKEIVLDFD